MIRPPRGVLDTSVVIGQEAGRGIDNTRLPIDSALSVVTVAELEVGVLAAPDVEIRSRRIQTLRSVADLTLLPVDEAAASIWARMRIHLAESGRRLNVNDLWIAATAAAHDLPVVTQDDDFDPVEGVAGLTVIRV